MVKKLILYNRIIFVLAIVGFLIAGYVLNGYLTSSSVYCPAGGGCDIVRKSSYSWIMGKIPVPGVGFVGYAAILALAFLRTVKPQADRKLVYGLMGMTIFGALFVTGFSLTQAFLIKQFCFWCIMSTVIMFTIFGLTLVSFFEKSKEGYVKRN